MRNKNVILFLMLGILLILVCFIAYIEINSNDSLDVFYINNSDVSDVSDVDDGNINDVVVDSNMIIEETKTNYDVIEETTSVNEDKWSFIDKYNEEEIIGYFKNMEEKIYQSKSFDDEFKDYFVTVVDFVFYDKEIGGYTFAQLSDIAKIKIIGLALKIDAKIEEYIPNYKETISSTSSDIYSNVKEKLVMLYMDISTDVCKDNKDDCDNVKEIWKDIMSVCKIGWEFIKTFVSSGTSKLKDWYEIYSGK